MGAELMSFFEVFIRPVIEYCSLIYHPLLTVAQEKEIEKLQKHAVRLAFGWDNTYEEICQIRNISTLKKRREIYIDGFIMKNVLHHRFKDSWFPLRDADTHNIRDRRPYHETRSKTSRYYNSPLSFLRRSANDLHSSQEIRSNDD